MHCSSVYSRTYRRELDLFQAEGAYDSGRTTAGVLGRGYYMDSDDKDAPIRLGFITPTAYLV
jgi:hypothetical protein